MSPPGWYPDPWTPGAMRWWSGRDWTAYTTYGAPGATGYGKPTDGFAIASLITSVVGLSPIGIVLGLIAKRRIRQAGGERDGGGLATAGIAIGCVFLALTGVVVTLALNGTFDEVNRDDYSGEDARVADVVDRFEEAFENADGAEICNNLFTPALAEEYAADGGCEEHWNAGTAGYAEFDIYQLDVFADSATAVADDENESRDRTFQLERYPGGGWRIYAME